MKGWPSWGLVFLITAVSIAPAHAGKSRVEFEEKTSDTVAVVQGGSVIITSAKHGYKLVLPHGGTEFQYSWSWTTPLRVRTETYVAVVREIARNEDSASDYLHEALLSLKQDPSLQISNDENLADAERPILRYMVLLKDVPEVSKEPNYWRWNYLMAVPKAKTWLVLHVSTSLKAREGKLPRDGWVVRLMRTAFCVTSEGESDNRMHHPAGGLSEENFVRIFARRR